MAELAYERYKYPRERYLAVKNFAEPPRTYQAPGSGPEAATYWIGSIRSLPKDHAVRLMAIDGGWLVIGKGSEYIVLGLAIKADDGETFLAYRKTYPLREALRLTRELVSASKHPVKEQEPDE